MSAAVLRRLCAAILILLSTLQLVGCASSRVALRGLEPAPQVDLQRYSGRWYVIANIPYWAESGKVGTYVEYRLQPDGTIEDLFFFRKRNFAAPQERWEGYGWVIPDTGNAVWKTRFVWPFTVDYVILEVDADYQWALVGHPKRELAWIFHRDPVIDEKLYLELRDKFAAQGYVADRMRRVPQQREQLGAAGFQ